MSDCAPQDDKSTAPCLDRFQRLPESLRRVRKCPPDHLHITPRLNGTEFLPLLTSEGVQSANDLCHAESVHVLSRHNGTSTSAARLRSLSFAMTLSLTSGGLGLLASSLTGWSCPLRRVDLACPGCGCGRAAMLFLNDGISAVISTQPTAGLFLVVMAAVLGATLIGWRSGVTAFGEKVVFRTSVLALSLSGLANLLYQLGART